MRSDLMSNEHNKSDDLADLVGPPALLCGEDEARYHALQAEIERTLAPKTILDRIDVRDITDKIWEAERYKRFESRLIESARVSALAHILAPIFDLDHKKGFEAANMYYGRDPQQRKLAAGLLSDHGITDEMILAKAAAQNDGHLGRIDVLIANRERSRNRVLKEHQHRRQHSAMSAAMDPRKANEPARRTQTADGESPSIAPALSPQGLDR
jgi:hypothetical protein